MGVFKGEEELLVVDVDVEAIEVEELGGLEEEGCGGVRRPFLQLDGACQQLIEGSIGGATNGPQKSRRLLRAIREKRSNVKAVGNPTRRRSRPKRQTAE